MLLIKSTPISRDQEDPDAAIGLDAAVAGPWTRLRKRTSHSHMSGHIKGPNTYEVYEFRSVDYVSLILLYVRV